MPDEPIDSDVEVEATEPAKKKGIVKKLLIAFVLILAIAGAGAGGFYYWRHRAAKAAAAGTAGDKKKGKAEAKAPSEGEADVKEVIELQPFIVNLADKNESRYLRMTISLGVAESSEKADPIFTTRVRNAILATITNKTSDQVLTIEGKAALRKEMLEAARAAVEKPEVNAIYITDFIVQM